MLEVGSLHETVSCRFRAEPAQGQLNSLNTFKRFYDSKPNEWDFLKYELKPTSKPKQKTQAKPHTQPQTVNFIHAKT